MQPVAAVEQCISVAAAAAVVELLSAAGSALPVGL